MPGLILVVDDVAAHRELVEALLENEGLQVVTASDGHQALEEFRRSKPDLVLLDVDMPLVSGFEVCQPLKENPETRLTLWYW